MTRDGLVAEEGDLEPALPQDVLIGPGDPFASSGSVQTIRIDDGSPGVVWTREVVASSPLVANSALPQYRVVQRPQAVMGVRTLTVSPEEMEEQREIKKWTEMLRSDQPAAEKEKARKSLSQLLEKQFGRDMERREKEVAQLEERVKKLRTQVEKRMEAKEKIIDLRLDTIQQEADGLGFPEGAVSRPTQSRQPFTMKLTPPPPPQSPSVSIPAPPVSVELQSR